MEEDEAGVEGIHTVVIPPLEDLAGQPIRGHMEGPTEFPTLLLRVAISKHQTGQLATETWLHLSRQGMILGRTVNSTPGGSLEH